MTVPSFSHIADHPHIRAVERQLAANPEFANFGPDWNQTIDLMQSVAEKSHREAAMIMHEFEVTKRPFGLYLRSFESESYHYFSADVVPDRDGGTVTTSYSGPTNVETKIAQALAGRLPMLAIANPSQLNTSSGIIPRLQLPSEGWQQVVRNLVEFAHLIVMDCETLAPGVIWELDTIAGLQRADATIVILPVRATDTTHMQTIAEVLGAVVQRRPPATKSDPQLANVRRVAYEDEIDFDRIDQSQLFADLLADAAEKSAKAPAFDAKAYAHMLSNEGVLLTDQRQFAEAFNLHTQALLVRRHLDDREGIKQLGQREEAITWLRAGYVLQAEVGTTPETQTTLFQLSELHREAGDHEAMLECYRLIQQHYPT